MIRSLPQPRPKWFRARPKVTLCIAAICQEEKDPKIVVCNDWRQESYLAHSETADKLRLLPHGWSALVADTANRDEELVALYEKEFMAMDGFKFASDADLFAVMKKPAQQYKANLANEYIFHTLGMSYADFLKADNVPDDFITKRLHEISNIKLGAALILAGFVEMLDFATKKVEKNAYLFVVEDDEGHQDVVRTEDNFAVIGSGRHVAVPTLTQRKLDASQCLMETIYSVYEAKRLAEVVPGVGEYTSIDVFGPNGRMWSLSDKGHEHCKDLFRRLGPRLGLSDKKKLKMFEFEDDFLEPFGKDEKTSKKKETAKKLKKKSGKFFGVDRPMPGE